MLLALHLGMFDFGGLRCTIFLQFQKTSYFEMIVDSLETVKIVQRSHVPVFSIVTSSITTNSTIS